MSAARNTTYYYSPRYTRFFETRAQPIRPLFQPSLNEINKVNRELGMILKGCIKEKYSLQKFERFVLKMVLSFPAEH